MHSLNQQDLARVVASERVEVAHGRAIGRRPPNPPPVLRSRVAYVAARVANRLDPAAARRAVV
jgi:hypothetical protein